MKSKPRKLPWSVRGKYTAFDKGPKAGNYRFMVRVWDAKVDKYVSPSFPTEAEAKAFAESQSAKFVLGQDRAGAVTIGGTKDEFFAYQRAKDITEHHIREAVLLLQAMQDFGLNDLKSPTIQGDATRFFAQLKSRMKRTVTKGQEKPIAKATQVKLMAILSTYGNWLADHEPAYLPKNPWRKLPRPRLVQSIPAVFLLEECQTLTSDRALAMPEGLQVALRIYTGMRKEEAYWLRWEHIMWKAGRIQVRLPDDFDQREAQLLGVKVKALKRDKERLVILPPELAEILRPMAKEGHCYIFPDRMRSRATSTERKAYREHLAALKIVEGDRNPHQMRATNASVYIAAKLDVIQSKAHLGHEDLKTTDGYARAAGLFSEQCRVWNGELKFRASGQCNSSANSGSNSEMTAVEPSDPEEELFVILPSTSEIVREYAAVCENQSLSLENPRVAGSNPAKATIHNLLRKMNLESEEDDIQAS
jgi:integrase